MEIVKVEKPEQIEMVEKIAAIVWEEHYKGNLSDEQIKYMLVKFQSFQAIFEAIKSDGYEYYLFYIGDVPFGYMGFKAKNNKLFLSKLYILKECRGKGYSKKAFEFMEHYCKHNGLTSIWLTCNKNNANSLKVYEKSGFKFVREMVTDIGHGYVMDDYVLEKDL